MLDEYPGDRILVAEAWVQPAERLARYVRPDEMHQAFNFEYLDAPWTRRPSARSIDPLAGRQRRGRRPDHLGAVQPRRGAARDPARPARSARRARTASAPATRSRTPRWACAGPARPRC